MAKKITIKKDRSLTPERIMKIITDANEVKIQRPKQKGNQKKFYSGKKKTNTIKAEMTMSEDGKIISVSKCHSGKVHDFKIKTEQNRFQEIVINMVILAIRDGRRLQAMLFFQLTK